MCLLIILRILHDISDLQFFLASSDISDDELGEDCCQFTDGVSRTGASQSGYVEFELYGGKESLRCNFLKRISVHNA